MPKIGQSITQREYYQNNGSDPSSENWGTYQYLLLEDVINNFLLSYVGDDKVINKVDRNEVAEIYPVTITGTAGGSQTYTDVSNFVYLSP